MLKKLTELMKKFPRTTYVAKIVLVGAVLPLAVWPALLLSEFLIGLTQNIAGQSPSPTQTSTPLVSFDAVWRTSVVMVVLITLALTTLASAQVIGERLANKGGES